MFGNVNEIQEVKINLSQVTKRMQNTFYKNTTISVPVIQRTVYPSEWTCSESEPYTAVSPKSTKCIYNNMIIMFSPLSEVNVAIVPETLQVPSVQNGSVKDNRSAASSSICMPSPSLVSPCHSKCFSSLPSVDRSNWVPPPFTTIKFTLAWVHVYWGHVFKANT
jgi:hypothetical protein